MGQPRPRFTQPTVRTHVPQDPDKLYWISCRATKNCEGKQAKLVFTREGGVDGRIQRFRCVTCNRTFHAQT